MKLRSILACTLLLFAVGLARADVINFTINSGPYFDGSYFVGPYNSTVTLHDAQDPDLAFPVQSFCIDFTDHVGFGETFGVRALNLADFQGPLQQNYWQAGWIALQMLSTTDPATISDMQRAIWLITTPGTTEPYLTTLGSFTWAQQAAFNYQSVPISSFTIYLHTGDTGQDQLVINSVPEPGTFAFAVVGSLALFGLRQWNRKTASA